MKTFKIIVYSALLLFHLTAIIIISVGRNDLNFLLNLFKRMDLMMYSAYVGLVLFLIVIFFEWRQQQNIKQLHKKHSQEIHELKAKLYDTKESSDNKKPAPSSESTSPNSEEKKEGNEEENKS
jgi:cytoskeletal protein RodZ